MTEAAGAGTDGGGTLSFGNIVGGRVNLKEHKEKKSECVHEKLCKLFSFMLWFKKCNKSLFSVTDSLLPREVNPELSKTWHSEVKIVCRRRWKCGDYKFMISRESGVCFRMLWLVSLMMSKAMEDYLSAVKTKVSLSLLYMHVLISTLSVQ